MPAPASPTATVEAKQLVPKMTLVVDTLNVMLVLQPKSGCQVSQPDGSSLVVFLKYAGITDLSQAHHHQFDHP